MRSLPSGILGPEPHHPMLVGSGTLKIVRRGQLSILRTLLDSSTQEFRSQAKILLAICWCKANPLPAKKHTMDAPNIVGSSNPKLKVKKARQQAIHRSP